MKINSYRKCRSNTSNKDKIPASKGAPARTASHADLPNASLEDTHRRRSARPARAVPDSIVSGHKGSSFHLHPGSTSKRLAQSRRYCLYVPSIACRLCLYVQTIPSVPIRPVRAAVTSGESCCLDTNGSPNNFSGAGDDKQRSRFAR